MKKKKKNVNNKEEELMTTMMAYLKDHSSTDINECDNEMIKKLFEGKG